LLKLGVSADFSTPILFAAPFGEMEPALSRVLAVEMSRTSVMDGRDSYCSFAGQFPPFPWSPIGFACCACCRQRSNLRHAFEGDRLCSGSCAADTIPTSLSAWSSTNGPGTIGYRSFKKTTDSDS
jgi:hypothetical protein